MAGHKVDHGSAAELADSIYEQRVLLALGREPSSVFLAIATPSEDYESDAKRANAVRRLLARRSGEAVFTIRVGTSSGPVDTKDNPVQWFPSDLPKECRVCGLVKPSDERYFYFHWGRNSFDSRCKECVLIKMRTKYWGNPEYREKEKAKARTPASRERQNSQRKERYAENPQYREKLLAQKRAKYRNDPECRERIKAKNRTPEYRERKNERRRERYASDKQYREDVLAQNRERRSTDEVRSAISARRRAPEYRDQKNRRRRERTANDPDHRERENALRRNKRATDEEYRDRQNARDKKRYDENPQRREQNKKSSLHNLYGISLNELERMKTDQGGRCAICGKKTRLGVDHDHHTERIRGLLCNVCNLGLGGTMNNANVISNAIAYLNLPETAPADVPEIPAERWFARFDIPHWQGQSRDKIYRERKSTYMKNHFGISIDQYEALLEIGDGVCWICSNPEVNQSNPKSKYPDALAVDHNPLTEGIRGLLCANCNMGIGKFYHDAERLGSAISYLTNSDVLQSKQNWHHAR